MTSTVIQSSLFEVVNNGYGYCDYEPIEAATVRGWSRVTINENIGESDYAMLGDTGRSVHISRDRAEKMIRGDWFPKHQDAK